MQSFSVRDVERVLRLSRSTIRGLIDVGFVTPSRGPRQEYRFSFQDMIVLRTARALIQAKVPRKRIRRSLADLRRLLPEALPLSGLSICAVGDQVVVRDGKSHYQANNGQYLLGLDVSMENGVLRMVEQREVPPAGRGQSAAPAEADGPSESDGQGWFDRGLELESEDAPAAAEAYKRAVDIEPDYAAAWTNWGRLLHERGELQEAESLYRRALEQCGPDAVLYFNLGVLLEDLGRIGPALEAYQGAIGEDSNFADGHYNLARLYESLGKTQHAIRHLGQYRRLVATENH